MLLPRRAVSAAAARVSSSSTRCLTPTSIVRFYSTEAEAPPAQAAPSPAPTTSAPPKTTPVASKTTSTAPTSTWSKWAKPKPTPAAAAAASSSSASTTVRTASSTSKSSALEPPPPYQPTTIAHRPVTTDGNAANPPTQAPPGTNWSTSFHGISTCPVTVEQFNVLMAPIPIKDIEVKPDGVIYLPEIKYRRRLNETFGPMGWGMIPKGEAVVGNAVVTREYALIVDGRFVSQAQGENGFFSPDQLPSAVEGCKSNALMRCCKDLCIASELWDPHFVRWFRKTHMEEVWVEHAVTKKKRTFWYRKGEVDVAYPYKQTK